MYSDNPEEKSRMEIAWKNIHRDKSDFHVGRNGDHLLIPFECDQCVFVKLRGNRPMERDPRDKLLMACIRRMNLDAFWSRETSTVRNNARRAERQLALSELVGLEGPFIFKGVLPDYDYCGYQVAINILLASRRPGKHSSSHTQYDTVRGYRSTYSNFIRTSPQANQVTMAMGDFNGNYTRFAIDEYGSLFFKRFMDGLKTRMGSIWIPNTAFSTELMLEIISTAEKRIEQSETSEERIQWICFVTYATISYVLSLRGQEGLLLDLGGLIRNWDESTYYVKVALLGRVKGERGDRAHILPCINVTSSGIRVRDVLDRLISMKKEAGFTMGPAISTAQGKLLSMRMLNDMLHLTLTDIFFEKRYLFPLRMTNVEDLNQHYQCFRSFRKASDTRALEKKVDMSDIVLVNRWKTVEQAKGKRPSLSMAQHYAQFELLVEPFLRYTLAM